MKKIYLILSLLLAIYAYTIPCVFQPPPRRQLSFKISEDEELVSTIYEGVNIVIDSKDGYLSQGIKKQGSDNINLRAFGRFVKQGQTFINIGSHIGLEALVYGQIIGPKGKMFFFQPNRRTRSILTKNIYINNLNKIATVYPVAVSNTKMKAYITINYGNTGASRVQTEQSLRGSDRYYNEKYQIQVDLVDNVLSKDLIVDFAFIDVEALDVQCLEGMKQTIKRSPNLVIVTQWSGFSAIWPRDVYLTHLKALLEWFRSINYKFYKPYAQNLIYRASDCKKNETMIQMSNEELLSITDQLYQKEVQLDFVFAPNHVDPNANS